MIPLAQLIPLLTPLISALAPELAKLLEDIIERSGGDDAKAKAEIRAMTDFGAQRHAQEALMDARLADHFKGTSK